MGVSFHTVFAVLGYSASSIAIMFVNKIILTANHFPSTLFLAICQMFTTLIVVSVLSAIGKVKIPAPSIELLTKIAPFSVLFAVDLTMGLAGTGAISLPLFSALRRFSNLFIMYGEMFFFKKQHSSLTHLSLFIMVGGAITAAGGDLKFDLIGYTFIFINNLSTAGKGLMAKSNLSKHNISSVTLLFYNSLLMCLPLLALAIALGNVKSAIHFPLWSKPLFVLGFFFSCVAALVLQFLAFECTRLTSALTTSVIGVIKNVVVTYGGMFVGGDYLFTVTNFTGVTVSTIGAALYIVAKYKDQPRRSIDCCDDAEGKKSLHPPNETCVSYSDPPALKPVATDGHASHPSALFLPTSSPNLGISTT
uniref:UDP-sugar transporter UST74c n=2 Tax=Schistocephalus solidus TaxID=70667 RepID=A0A0X3PVE1_SCHSO